jgi:translation initiation factor 2B subunit (eIF-2B alpha/beta/delta family)
LIEIREEVGLSEEQVKLIRPGEVLRAYDDETDTVWVVHPFLFEAKSKTIRLDWENTEYVWTNPNNLGSYPTVPKLWEVFDRVRRDLQTVPESLNPTLRSVDELARDRVHGASFLGRRAIELLSATSLASKTEDRDDFFSDLLLVAMRLRKAQPGMAIIWNLVGRFLQLVDRERNRVSSLAELKRISAEIGEEIVQAAKEVSEDASRNSARTLPQTGHVLTHSYSSAVLRSLELGRKSGKRFEVYATESYPGMEGTQLAKDLVALGVPVKVIPDSRVDSIISTVNFVLVGADSVLRDGSLIHKTGTRRIAAAARESGVPFHSTCETMKFSVTDFLGESPKFADNLFDLTPSEYIEDFTTEVGRVEPDRVEELLRGIVRETYP